MTPDTPIFWSTWGQARRGKVRQPMTGKNLWRLCKTYGRLIGYPQPKPHDLRHGVAMEVYAQHGDLEQVRGLLGHARIDTTRLCADPAGAAQAGGGVLRGPGARGADEVNATFNSVFEELLRVPQTRSEKR